ncbi:Teichoic acid poly(glycerol phosphate) polymerase [Lentibacillus sp. JNUCC-1]|uniref:CDP-glycerol glycerophosphotransferase family protein n=1 Tax=Lentibacillus sp. JNUCC-1 TaxID=2654513 RepID=UPI0012E7C6B5|nr:CDP-glycerol glycerophosphotransferase family protein [Lentibacillus sp. JNUCC-1]MUV36908.1 Teichoic acid poly(glycerol phosphate) polymerase [Lentibacillus sp. JNUCC-1]
MTIIDTVKHFVCRSMILIFNCFPVKHHKIFLFSYYGSQYGCNPKSITEYLLSQYPKDRFDLVWAFNDPTSKTLPSGIRTVKTMTLRYFYELCTAKVIITNFRTTDLFVKRKQQYYIQTWHSSLRLKQIEKDAEASLPQRYITMAQKDSRKCDLLLSGCQRSTEIFKRAFWYTGEIFEHGTPRNDMLVQGDPSKQAFIRDRLNVTGKNVVLYAPTFRKDGNMDVYDLDYDRLAKRLTDKYGGEWTILIKLHPHLMSQSDQIIQGDHVRDVTAYDDIQELLMVADVLISDYSSLIFDFSITKRPCFLYVPDLMDYRQKERALYFDIEALPFPSAQSNQDLMETIMSFDEENYHRQMGAFLAEVGSYEDGRAAEHLAHRLEAICVSEKRSEVYEAL